MSLDDAPAGTPALDPHARYVRTAPGHAELASPRHALLPQARRALALSDGEHALAELAQRARPGEIESAVALLVSLGLVEPAGGTRRAPLAWRQRRLAALKRDLDGLFESALGADGIVADARVRDSVDSDRLRRVLREAIDHARLRGGESIAADLAHRVRRLAPDASRSGAGAAGPDERL